MFHVLTKPFPRAIAAHMSSKEPQITLVYSGERAERVLAVLAPSSDRFDESVEWFRTVALELNDLRDFLFLKTMLGSIRETARTWELAERARLRNRRVRDNLGADFGRLDFSSPGRGGHGFDDGDGY
jgi:hypothetical protein